MKHRAWCTNRFLAGRDCKVAVEQAPQTIPPSPHGASKIHHSCIQDPLDATITFSWHPTKLRRRVESLLLSLLYLLHFALIATAHSLACAFFQQSVQVSQVRLRSRSCPQPFASPQATRCDFVEQLAFVQRQGSSSRASRLSTSRNCIALPSRRRQRPCSHFSHSACWPARHWQLCPPSLPKAPSSSTAMATNSTSRVWHNP